MPKSNKDSSLSIDIDVKVGILHTVANAIYASPVGKIREAVANAKDNEATWIVILADQTANTLYIYDNGQGITEKRFHEIFKSIGYGLFSDIPGTKLSYFGLGLMSIFQLGNKVKLITKPRNKQNMYVLEIDTEAIFKPENKDKSISSLKTHFDLKGTNEKKREAISALPLDNFIKKELGGKPLNFTEIIIEDVKDEDIEAICDPLFEEELSKSLPLKYDPDEPFLKKFHGKKGKNIKALLENTAFCPTIDVFFGIRDDDSDESLEGDENYIISQRKGIRKLWKYFPRFRDDLEFPDSNVLLKTSNKDNFAYYIVHSVAKDLYRQKVTERENGLWIRNQNFLVKAADFLEKPGRGRPLISAPLRTWIFGEIFHKDMNHFLTVSRNDFLFDEKSFTDFRSKIYKLVNPLDKTLRTIWEEKNKIIERVINPFTKVGETGGAIENTEKRLHQLVGQDCPEDKFYEQMRDKLRKNQKKEIEDDETRIDLILSQTEDPILIGDDENVLVKIDPNIKNKVHDFETSWNDTTEKVEVSVSIDLFNPQEVIFLGDTYKVVFVAKEEADPGVSVNVDKKKIYINPFNKELSLYSITIIEIIIALEVAHAMSDNKDQLKDNFLSLIGVKPTGTQQYITPLGDDLRRGLAYRRFRS